MSERKYDLPREVAFDADDEDELVPRSTEWWKDARRMNPE